MRPSLPKIIFFDIDDTLYHKQTNSVPASTQQALHALSQQGIIVAIATGRGLGVLPTAIQTLVAEVSIELFVTINGQYNRYQDRIVSHFALERNQIILVSDYLMHQEIGMAYMTADEIVCFGETPPVVAALTSLEIPYRVYPTSYQTFLHGSAQVYQILAFFADNSLSVALNDVLPDDLKTVRWHLFGVDILDKHGSKARGIKSVLDQLGIDPKDAMAFGDGLNDLEMMQAVGFGVAMGNAHPALKQVCDWVCPAVYEDGIWRGLKALGVI